MFSLSNGYVDETLKSIRQNGGTEPKPREISLGELAKKGGIVGVKAISSQADSRLVKMPQAFLFGVTRFFTPSDLACTMVACQSMKVQLSKDVFWKVFAQKILWPVIESPFQPKVCKYYADQTKTLIRISNSAISTFKFGSVIKNDYLPFNASYLKAVGNLRIFKYISGVNDLLKCMLQEIPSSATTARHMFIEADLVEYAEMIHDTWDPIT